MEKIGGTIFYLYIDILQICYLPSLGQCVWSFDFCLAQSLR